MARDTSAESVGRPSGWAVAATGAAVLAPLVLLAHTVDLMARLEAQAPTCAGGGGRRVHGPVSAIEPRSLTCAGPAVRHVAIGQQVFGYARKDFVGAGTWAERVAVPARGVAAAPSTVEAVVASCLPLAGMTAWQCLVEDLQVGEGDTLLVHAATGGVGHLATQIAVARGARVIGTCSEPNHDFLRALGGEPVRYGDGVAARVRELAPEGVDAVADFVGGGALEASDELLRVPRRVVSVRDPQGAKQRGGTYVFVRPDPTHLAALAELVDAGRLTPHVQSVYDLDAVRDAVSEASSGRVRGKVVIRV